MAKFRSFNMFQDDWIAGTMELSLEQEAAFLRVCLLIHSKGGPIPDNERWLAGMCRVSTRRWRKLRDELVTAGKIVKIDGKIDQKRCRKDLEKASSLSRKRAESASKSHRNSHEPNDKPLENNDTGFANATPRARVPLPQPLPIREEKKETAPSGAAKKEADLQKSAALPPDPAASNSDPDPRKKPPPKKMPTHLPEDWVASPELRDFAAAKGFNEGQIDDIQESFRDYWVAKPKDATKRDWNATWRTWVKRDAEKRGNGQSIARGGRQPPRGGSDSFLNAGLDILSEEERKDQFH